MIEACEIDVHLKLLSHPGKEPELVHGRCQAKNSAVPNQCTPNACILSYVFPLQDTKDKAERDEAKNDAGGVQTCITCRCPTNDSKYEKTDQNLFFSAHRSDGSQSLSSNFLVVYLRDCRLINNMQEPRRKQKNGSGPGQ